MVTAEHADATGQAARPAPALRRLGPAGFCAEVDASREAGGWHGLSAAARRAQALAPRPGDHPGGPVVWETGQPLRPVPATAADGGEKDGNPHRPVDPEPAEETAARHGGEGGFG